MCVCVCMWLLLLRRAKHGDRARSPLCPGFQLEGFVVIGRANCARTSVHKVVCPPAAAAERSSGAVQEPAQRIAQTAGATLIRAHDRARPAACGAGGRRAQRYDCSLGLVRPAPEPVAKLRGVRERGVPLGRQGRLSNFAAARARVRAPGACKFPALSILHLTAHSG